MTLLNPLISLRIGSRIGWAHWFALVVRKPLKTLVQRMRISVRAQHPHTPIEVSPLWKWDTSVTVGLPSSPNSAPNFEGTTSP